MKLCHVCKTRLSTGNHEDGEVFYYCDGCGADWS